MSISPSNYARNMIFYRKYFQRSKRQWLKHLSFIVLIKNDKDPCCRYYEVLDELRWKYLHVLCLGIYIILFRYSLTENLIKYVNAGTYFSIAYKLLDDGYHIPFVFYPLVTPEYIYYLRPNLDIIESLNYNVIIDWPAHSLPSNGSSF